jgi:hypothetical protein
MKKVEKEEKEGRERNEIGSEKEIKGEVEGDAREKERTRGSAIGKHSSHALRQNV